MLSSMGGEEDPLCVVGLRYIGVAAAKSVDASD